MVKNPFGHMDCLVITCNFIVRAINATLDVFHGPNVRKSEGSLLIIFWHFFFLEKMEPYRVIKCANMFEHQYKTHQMIDLDTGWHAGTSLIAE